MKTDGLKQLIESALKDGQEDPVKPASAERLRIGAGKAVRKWIRCTAASSPDKKEHTFSVVIDKNKNPISVILSVGNSREAAATGITIYKASLDGTLEFAFRSEGDISDTKIAPIDLEIGAQATRDDFAREIAFYQLNAKNLEGKAEKKDS